MKNLLFGSLLFFLFSPTILGQTPQPSATPPVANDTDVVKISTTLIQLDVVVTDKKGNQVKDLKSEDFEVFENGKKQDITNFTYIFVNPPRPSANSPVAEKNPKINDAPPVPSAKLKLEQVRRTYAIVVDDLGLSFENVPAVRQSLKKFVNEQIQEGDLVAVIRTGSGIGALQSFTTDKRQLLAAIEKVRWNPQGRGGISSFSAIAPTSKERLNGETADGTTKTVEGAKEDAGFQKQIDEYRSENFSAGTIGALNYIIRGMKKLPGRKSVVLFSEGFQLLKAENGSLTVSRSLQNLRVLADIANRSSVVFYTIDPRGLQIPGMLTAEDNTFGTTAESAAEKRRSRDDEFTDSQQSLRYLAYETGGLPFVNQNNLNLGLQKAIDDQKGYYLIGYQPDSETFDPKKSKFNKLSVKLKRDGFKVRYRSGFFGITDKNLADVKQTPQQQIYNALTSPFDANDIALNLNALFANDEKSGSFIRSLVNIKAQDLKFTQETDGTRKANFDIIAMTFGDNGAPVDEVAKNYTIRVGEKAFQKIMEKGFVYNLTVPIKKAGAYQFRIALRDSGSEKVGSASQFIEIPNLKKGKLTLSGIVVRNFPPEEWRKITLGQRQLNAQTNDEAGSLTDTAVRRFKRGTVLFYEYLIYNVRKNAPQPAQLQIQVRLLREKSVVTEGRATAADTGGQTNLGQIQNAGAITLGSSLPPGDYILQLIVTDESAKKNQQATQFIEFEVVE